MIFQEELRVVAVPRTPEPPVASELFRKLVNFNFGQGESERICKKVKKHRTTFRNGQFHQVTASFCGIKCYLQNDISERKTGTNECMHGVPA